MEIIDDNYNATMLIKFLKSLFEKYHFTFVGRQYSCQIKEFNLHAKEVVVYCYGVRIIRIKSSIAEIIGDPQVVLNLPPDQAAWLGYYYGKLCVRNAENAAAFHAKGGSFLLRFTRGRFKIFSFNRDNNLNYIDLKTNKYYQESPVTIVQNNYIINQFDPSQACYIGVLAGTIVAKHGEEIIETSKKLILTVIK